jgi:hypothetical protein
MKLQPTIPEYNEAPPLLHEMNGLAIITDKTKPSAGSLTNWPQFYPPILGSAFGGIVLRYRF